MEKLEHCPACESSDYEEFIFCKDYLVSGEKFSIVTCRKCGLLFTNPRPEKELLGAYYKSDEYISHSVAAKGLINRLYFIIRKYTLHKKERMVKKYAGQKKILDFGCGTGLFLSVCRKRGWETLGIESNENAANSGKEKFGLVIKKDDYLRTIPSGAFHIITLWHVLEHISPLSDTIAELRRILHEHGRMVVAVPDSGCLDAHLYGEKWAGYDVPRHLYHFTKKTISLFFDKQGMEIQDVFPMKFDAYYVSMLSEKNLSGKINFLKVLKNGYRSNKWAKRNHQCYSSIVYIIKKRDKE